MKFGVNGQADISGIMSDGKRLEIEVKSERGRQSKAQKAFQRVIERMGGVYILARCVEDVVSRLDALDLPPVSFREPQGSAKTPGT